ncbi:MAG: hypothetical protein LBN97_02790 [Oscillospiraceae bacterium]|jgi:hypothetical protein|nr:hypothetical protein [Oscillospiraceae bacterium]
MKKLAVIALIIMPAILTACSQLDVVGTDAVRAFGEIVSSMDSVDDSGTWHLTAPDGKTVLILNDNFVSITFEAQPFYDAGFNGEIQEQFVKERGISDANKSHDSPRNMVEHIVKNDREIVGYHSALDHYNIDLGDGNMFEWAKDLSSNDKDIVFVLNPEPFINAGVDPNAIEGWTFAKVPTDNGEVDKLLKFFDLK